MRAGASSPVSPSLRPSAFTCRPYVRRCGSLPPGLRRLASPYARCPSVSAPRHARSVAEAAKNAEPPTSLRELKTCVPGRGKAPVVAPFFCHSLQLLFAKKLRGPLGLLRKTSLPGPRPFVSVFFPMLPVTDPTKCDVRCEERCRTNCPSLNAREARANCPSLNAREARANARA